MKEDKRNKITLFIRFLKEKELYEIMKNKTVQPSSINTMLFIDRLILLPSYYFTLTRQVNNNTLTAEWEEFYIYHIHHKTKIQVLEEALDKYDLSTLIYDMRKQKRYPSIECLLKYNTMQGCVDKALTWNQTEKGSHFYMQLYNKINKHLMNQYKDLYDYYHLYVRKEKE